MRRAWAALLFLACGCATTAAVDRVASTAGEEREVRCRLIGSVAGGINEFEVRNAVLDETKTLGPSRVVWLHPPNASIIKTVEGDLYRCDAPL